MRATAFERAAPTPCRSARQRNHRLRNPTALADQPGSACSLACSPTATAACRCPHRPGFHRLTGRVAGSAGRKRFSDLRGGARCWRGAASRTSLLLQLAPLPAAGRHRSTLAQRIPCNDGGLASAALAAAQFLIGSQHEELEPNQRTYNKRGRPTDAAYLCRAPRCVWLTGELIAIEDATPCVPVDPSDPAECALCALGLVDFGGVPSAR